MAWDDDDDECVRVGATATGSGIAAVAGTETETGFAVCGLRFAVDRSAMIWGNGRQNININISSSRGEL